MKFQFKENFKLPEKAWLVSLNLQIESTFFRLFDYFSIPRRFSHKHLYPDYQEPQGLVAQSNCFPYLGTTNSGLFERAYPDIFYSV